MKKFWQLPDQQRNSVKGQQAYTIIETDYKSQNKLWAKI